MFQNSKFLCSNLLHRPIRGKVNFKYTFIQLCVYPTAFRAKNKDSRLFWSFIEKRARLLIEAQLSLKKSSPPRYDTRALTLFSVSRLREFFSSGIHESQVRD